MLVKPWTYRDLFILVFGVVVLVLFRLHAFDAPLEVDECNYASFGRGLLAGDQLYVDLWDHQPPGMFAYTAGLIALFGSSPVVFRVASTIAAATTLVLVYAVCKRAMGERACWLAAGLFAIASSDPGIAGEGCNREIYMNLLGVAGLWLILLPRWWALLLAGLCFGISSLLKTVVAAQWLCLFATILIIEVRGSRSWQVPWRSALLFAVGPVLVWACTFAYFGATGRFGVFCEAVFTYNVAYGRLDVPLLSKLTGFFRHGMEHAVFRSAAILWLAGALGTLLLPWKRRSRFALLAVAYAAGSFVAVCLPGRFWHHYYMLLLPSLVIGSAAVCDRLMPTATDRSRAGFAYGYAGLIVLVLLASQFVCYLTREPDDVALHRYGRRMSWAREQGWRVRRLTEPGDTIYVAGIDLGIYYYSGRRCPTRFVLPAMLAGEGESAARRRRLFVEDLRADRPRLILLVRGTAYLAELDRFIREVGYLKVGQDPDRMDVLCDPQRPVVWAE